MEWTDRIRQVKILIVFSAVIIAVVSLLVSHHLTVDLEAEERSKMEIWAEAMRTLNNPDENNNLNLVLKVIKENHSIPVIITDAQGTVQTFRNIQVKGRKDSLSYVSSLSQRLIRQGRYIKIAADTGTKSDYMLVCYDESLILKRLEIYPIVELGIVLIFVAVAIFALLTSKQAEQDRVWVGLSKETAHQLGTPISSLMAWEEILKVTYPQDELIPEMDKDIRRLQLIADRFSKIGSIPETVPCCVNAAIEHVVDYMEHRTSRKVIFKKDFPSHELIVKMNASLFEWVIENLCKNAVDAMSGEGMISIRLDETDTKVGIEVADNGKGIRGKDLGNVFRPGFTTKKRGWGLGLSLAKRIVEEYHHGKIWVKSSELGKGTTFRIEFKK